MSKKYYVIVDLYNLCYMSNEECEANISLANKFETDEEALKELKTYDDMTRFEIYEVTEHITRNLKRIRE